MIQKRPVILVLEYPNESRNSKNELKSLSWRMYQVTLVFESLDAFVGDCPLTVDSV